MSGSDSYRVKQNKLISQGGKCYWCSGEMTLERTNTRKLPHNYATFEHLVDRYDRPDRTQERQVVVLACFRCNKRRNNNKQRNLPLLEAYYRQWHNTNDFNCIPSNLKYLF